MELCPQLRGGTCKNKAETVYAQPLPNLNIQLGRSTSWNTSFNVWRCCCPGCSLTANLRAAGLPVLELATYSCPWVKTGDRSQTPTCFSVCPCDLLMVVAKAIRTGNWRLAQSKGKLPGSGMNLIRGIRTSLSVPANLHTRSLLLRVLW